jgi:Ca-activated chloride channel family protein
MARRTRRPGAISRIVLCADGVANEGVTAGEEILRRVRREADEGIALTTIGFGMGNFNDVLMERLADRGDGSYYYVDDLGEASRIFDRNLAGTLATVAREAKVQVTFDPRHVLRYRLLGFENRDVKDSDFRNDRVDAGEIGAGHEVTALYEVKLVPGSEHARIGSVRLRWAAPEHEGAGVPRVTEMEAPIRTEDFSGTFEGAPVRLRLDACVAEFAEILRGSYWAKESRIADLVPLANLLAVDLADDSAVVEFRDLVTNAAALDR